MSLESLKRFTCFTATRWWVKVTDQEVKATLVWCVIANCRKYFAKLFPFEINEHLSNICLKCFWISQFQISSFFSSLEEDRTGRVIVHCPEVHPCLYLRYYLKLFLDSFEEPFECKASPCSPGRCVWSEIVDLLTRGCNDGADSDEWITVPLPLTDPCRAESYSLIKLRSGHLLENRCLKFITAAMQKTVIAGERSWGWEGSQGGFISSLQWAVGKILLPLFFV